MLIAALETEGIRAYDWDSGGGIHFVCVDLPLLDDRWVAVAVGSNGAPCEVGVLSDDECVQSQFGWTPCSTISDVVGMIRSARAAAA